MPNIHISHQFYVSCFVALFLCWCGFDTLYSIPSLIVIHPHCLTGTATEEEKKSTSFFLCISHHTDWQCLVTPPALQRLSVVRITDYPQPCIISASCFAGLGYGLPVDAAYRDYISFMTVGDPSYHQHSHSMDYVHFVIPLTLRWKDCCQCVYVYIHHYHHFMFHAGMGWFDRIQ